MADQKDDDVAEKSKAPVSQRVRREWRNDPVGFAIKVVGAVGIAALVIWCAVALKNNLAEDANGNEAGATQACQKFVKQRLKAPGTADFSAQTPAQVDGPEWVVTGAVDSENSLSKSVRSSYRCQVTFDGVESWKLKQMKIS